jgi:repressor LexA
MMADFAKDPPQEDELAKCPRQSEVLNEILDAASGRRLSPTVGEIATRFSITRGCAYSTIVKLRDKGYIEWEAPPNSRRAVRGITLTRKAWIWRFSKRPSKDPDSRRIPVIGEGAGAGNARVAYEDVSEYLPLPARHLHRREAEAFMVEVVGDSMEGEDGVLPGDYVVVVPDENPKDGDMAVVIVEGEAYVKRLWHDGATICLESSNPAYHPITLGENDGVIVRGRVIGVVRWNIRQAKRSRRWRAG